LPVLSKSVGKVCDAPLRTTCSMLAVVTPLLVYCVFSAVTGFWPTVVSLVPMNRYTFWLAMLDLLSIAPLEL
jgi:hypothetical protein